MYKVNSPLLQKSSLSSAIISLFAAFILSVTLTVAQVSANSGAEGFVKRVGGQVLSVMSSGASDSAKQAKFKSLFVTHADTRRIGTFALGKYAKKIGGNRAEYDRLLKDYVVKVYYGHLKGYKGKAVEVKKSIDRGREVIVDSSFTFANRSAVPIKWRLLKTGGGFKIFDVNVAGVWLAIEQKSAFGSVISKNGGDPAAIIDFMKRQISKAS